MRGWVSSIYEISLSIFEVLDFENYLKVRYKSIKKAPAEASALMILTINY